MKSLHSLYAAVAVGVGVVAAPLASAQQVPVDAGLARQQQLNQERENRRDRERDRDRDRDRQGDRREDRGERRGDRGDRGERREERREAQAERREMKREREQLQNMPEGARKALRAETQNATDVDYYRVEGGEGRGDRGREFGAKFTAANGHQMDIRVDRTGQVVSRQDLTATASARTPTSPAQQPAPTTPTPTTPSPTRPTPGGAAASTEAPESGSSIYRRLQANEVPQNIRAVFEKDTRGASDVRYYRTKYGSQLAYEAKWKDAKGQEMRHYVSDAGQTLLRGESGDDDDDTRTAGASNRPNNRPDNSTNTRPDTTRPDTAIKTGRAELTDLPRPVQAHFRRATEGARDVKFYNTKYGSQQAYRADFRDRDGKERAIILDASGNVLSQKGGDDSSNNNRKNG